MKINKEMLLVGIMVFLLTGCGGGGGGGSGNATTITTTPVEQPSTSTSVEVPTEIVSNTGDTDITDGTYGKVGVTLGKEDSSYHGTITLTGDNAIGIFGRDYSTTTNKRSRAVTQYEFSNYGTINMSGRNAIGIYVEEKYNATNYGVINLNSKLVDDKINVEVSNENQKSVVYESDNSYTELTGMIGLKGGNITNEGEINLYGTGTGMAAYTGSTATNSGTIKMTAPELEYTVKTYDESVVDEFGIATLVSTEKVLKRGTVTGMYGEGSGTKLYNESAGVINVYGDAKGMHADDGAQAVNSGTIYIDGAGSWGMYASNNSTIINQGIINVGATASGGMHADSTSEAINRGTINIDNTNTTAVALGGAGKLTDSGTVNRYVVGTSRSGEYGKINANSIELVGTIEIEDNLTRDGYEEEYLLEDLVVADELKIGEEFALVSETVLYEAETDLSQGGKVNAKLVRNEKQLVDFVPENLQGVAKILGAYQNSENFVTLSEDAKEVLNSIDLRSGETITRDLEKFNPSIYANIGREIYDIANTFAEQEIKISEEIGEQKSYWTLFGNYSKVDSRNGIEGYKSTMVGVVAGINLGQGFLATVGYGNSDIDYKKSSDGEINSLHLGINKFLSTENADLRLGIRGEYNFHENKRNLSDFSRRAKTDFNSYWISGIGELSKNYGEELYARPFISLEIGAGGHESFTEKRADSLNAHFSSKNYTSVLPKVGIDMGATVERVKLYASAYFAYELGNMDRREKFSLEGFKGIEAYLSKDKIEGGAGTFKVGADYDWRSFNFSLTGGIQVGRRERKFGELTIGYKF